MDEMNSPTYAPQASGATRRPRRTVPAILLLILGPLLGLALMGGGSVAVAFGVAADSEPIANGQSVTLDRGDRRTVYAPEGATGSCAVTGPSGAVPTSASDAAGTSVRQQPYQPINDFVAPADGAYQVDCAGTTGELLVAPGVTPGTFALPLILGVIVILASVVGGVALLRRR